MEVVELAVDEESMVNVSLALESALGEPDTDPPPPDSVLREWSKNIKTSCRVSIDTLYKQYLQDFIQEGADAYMYFQTCQWGWWGGGL